MPINSTFSSFSARGYGSNTIPVSPYGFINYTIDGGINFPDVVFSDITTDSAGYIYVIGTSGTNISTQDQLIMKISSNTEQLIWQHELTTTGQQFNAIAIDSTDRIFVVGGSYLSEFDVNGTLVVNKYISDVSSVNLGEIYDIKIDSSDNIYILAVREISTSVYQNLVIKLDSSLNVIWSKRISPNSYNAANQRLGLTNDEPFLMIDPGTGTSMVIMKLDSGTGAIDWQHSLPSLPSNNYTACDSQGNIYVSCSTYTFNTADTLVKISSAGSIIWAMTIPTIDGSGIIAFTFDSADNVYINSTEHLIAIDAMGNFRWQNSLTSTDLVLSNTYVGGPTTLYSIARATLQSSPGYPQYAGVLFRLPLNGAIPYSGTYIYSVPITLSGGGAYTETNTFEYTNSYLFPSMITVTLSSSSATVTNFTVNVTTSGMAVGTTSLQYKPKRIGL